MKLTHGYTLIELIVCLLIAAIMLSFAAPSFIKLVQDSRQAQSVNQLLGGLNYARGEAVIGRRTVGICSGDTSCDGSRNWRQSLLIFEDNNRNGQLEPDENLLRRLELLADTSWNWSRFGQRPYLQFEANGTTRAANGTLTLCTNRLARHQLVISLSGRIRSRMPPPAARCE